MTNDCKFPWHGGHDQCVVTMMLLLLLLLWPLLLVVAVASYRDLAARFNQLDAQLQSSCGKQIHTLCADAIGAASTADSAAASSVAIEKCLESHRLTMDHRSDCREHLLHRLIESGRNVKLDPTLFDACREDLDDFCAGTDDAVVPGSQHECLRDHLDALSSLDCRALEMNRMQLELEDIRMNGFVCVASLFGNPATIQNLSSGSLLH